jgi:DsbC/DsbD-like thiol-disulfide interchange protein
MKLSPGLLIAFLAAASPARAESEALFASAPQKAQTSSARLIAGAREKDGKYAAGLEITLAPATITYWRQPGDAGTAPVFDFSRSTNVASVETLYPAPKHIEEAGSLVAGYEGKVIFPLRVTPRDAEAPVTLDLTLDYAACGKVCLPARARLSLALPQSGASPHAETVAQAQALAPRKLTESQARALFLLSRREGAANAWRLRYLGEDKTLDLFAEVAEPLFLDARRAADGQGFDLKLVLGCCGEEKPLARTPATLTLLTERGAFEAQVTLD